LKESLKKKQSNKFKLLTPFHIEIEKPVEIEVIKNVYIEIEKPIEKIVEKIVPVEKLSPKSKLLKILLKKLFHLETKVAKEIVV
jgi:hypothetical protein